MNKKDMKKSNISAGAISDDSLENVSGGYKVVQDPNSPIGERLELTKEEQKCLFNNPTFQTMEDRGPRGEALRDFNNSVATLNAHGFKKEN